MAAVIVYVDKLELMLMWMLKITRVFGRTDYCSVGESWCGVSQCIML